MLPPIRPLAFAPGMRLAGRVFTVSGRPADLRDYDGALRKVLRMHGEIPFGQVGVDACPHDEEKSTTENAIRRAVRDGMGPLRACERYGIF